MAKIAAMIAEGFEEVEALAVIDLLRRAAVDTDMISVCSEMSVTGAHGIKITADKCIDNTDFSDYDGIFLPGGMPGTNNLDACEKLCSAIQEFHREEKLLAAICAAPKVYGRLGVLNGRKATCFPGFENDLAGAEVLTDKVVTDGHIVTSRGMGTAIDLGIELVKILVGEETSENLAKGIQYR